MARLRVNYSKHARFLALILLLRFLFTNPIGIAIIVLFLIAMSSDSAEVMNITSSIVAFLIIVAIIVGIINFFRQF